ncbi:MAG: electron transport complex subunit E [Lachnospiraceae bacterium]|nr:electron transport complex subunit E [Lachnospiraceae bacterium]
MNKYVERIYNGIVKENPTFIMMLGMCPTLATTTSATNAIGMGLSTTAVLVMSNMLISAIRKVIPGRMRLPSEIVVVASLVTVVQLLMQAYTQDVYSALGIYIPLIVVNCIILGRAESFALFNTPILSFFDGLGMGLGFTFALVALGAFREILGAGSIFGFQIIPDDFHIGMMVLAPGAFLVLAFLTAIQNKLGLPSATNGGQESSEFVTSGDVFGAFNQSTDAADVKEA